MNRGHQFQIGLHFLSLFFKENRQDQPIPQPIPTDTQFVSFWSPVELNKFNWPRPTVVKTRDGHSFMLNEPLQHHISPNTSSATSTSSRYALTAAPFYSPSARRRTSIASGMARSTTESSSNSSNNSNNNSNKSNTSNNSNHSNNSKPTAHSQQPAAHKHSSTGEDPGGIEPETFWIWGALGGFGGHLTLQSFMPSAFTVKRNKKLAHLGSLSYKCRSCTKTNHPTI